MFQFVFRKPSNDRKKAIKNGLVFQLQIQMSETLKTIIAAIKQIIIEFWPKINFIVFIENYLSINYSFYTPE